MLSSFSMLIAPDRTHQGCNGRKLFVQCAASEVATAAAISVILYNGKKGDFEKGEHFPLTPLG